MGHDLSKLNPKLRERIIKDIQAQYPASDAVGAVEAASAKQPVAQALDGGKQIQPERAVGIRVIISLVAFRRQLLDRDAIAFASKPLTDAIAESLGIDDDDPRIEWEYSQVRTYGEQGVIVKFEIE